MAIYTFVYCCCEVRRYTFSTYNFLIRIIPILAVYKFIKKNTSTNYLHRHLIRLYWISPVPSLNPNSGLNRVLA